jgi:DNA uptake protein and related DNA-binding proteins
MKFRQFVRDYFAFTRNERKGIIILLVLIFVLAVANKMIFFFEKPGKLDVALFDSAKHVLANYNDSINSVLSASSDSGEQIKIFGENTKKNNSAGNDEKGKSSIEIQLFKFDPNVCSDEDFFKLGFTEKQTAAIRKYIEKGVTFKSRADFFKIRVITDKQKEQLASWIFIADTEQLHSNKVEDDGSFVVELNSADSLALQKLPGIGKILSKRIVKYRELLGGFYSLDQLKEVYGLSEPTFEKVKSKLKLDRTHVTKIDLNFTDNNELAKHPYIKKVLAGRIVKFRSRYGSIKDFSILKDSLILSSEEYERLKPYL